MQRNELTCIILGIKHQVKKKDGKVQSVKMLRPMYQWWILFLGIK